MKSAFKRAATIHPRYLPQPDYCDQYADLARKMIADAFNEEDVCDVIGIRRDTFDRWKISYPAFRNAVQQTGNQALASIAWTLIRRANGYAYHVEKIYLRRGSAIPIAKRETRNRRPSRAALYQLMRWFYFDVPRGMKRKDVEIPEYIVDAHRAREAQRQSFIRQRDKIRSNIG